MVDGGEPGVDSRDEGKHTGRNEFRITACTSRPLNNLNFKHPRWGGAIVKITKKYRYLSDGTIFTKFGMVMQNASLTTPKR